MWSICYYSLLVLCALNVRIIRSREGASPGSKEQPLNNVDSKAKVSEQVLASDVPFSGSRQGRILTGATPRHRASYIELRTSLGVAVGTAEQSDLLSPTPTSTGRRFYSFRGIPYAKAPIGPLRWSDPRPLDEPWNGGRLDATKYKPFCPQFDHDKKTVVGNEDCLYLNVFSPLLPGFDRRTVGLPVLVFIHGGAYSRGASSSHGAERLMREDIVLVTFNYRLGLFGLLSTNDKEFPGNYAALDQVTVLKWVRRYIAEFGGDYDSVTLAGFSSGASYVHLHTLSPLSQGLFQRAILMSGAGNCLWSIQHEPWLVARRLAEDLECPFSSSFDLRQCLIQKDTETLIRAQAKRSRFVYWPFAFRPVVDEGLREEPFLPAPVDEMLLKPVTSSVPVLIGGTPEEGILFALTVLLFSDENSNPRHVFTNSSRYIFESIWPNITSAKYLAEQLESFYFSENAKSDLNTLVAEMTDAVTDLFFTSCIWDAAATFASHSTPVYTYLMTHHDVDSPSFAAPLYRLALSAGVTSPLLRHGVSHGDDVILIFNFPYTPNDLSPRDLQMSILLTSIIASFTRSGDPHSRAASQFPPWEPIKPGEPVFYYRVSLKPAMIQKQFRNKERNLWKQTVPQLEETYEVSRVSWNWQIAFWVMFLLLLLIIISVIVFALILRRSRHSKKYPPGVGATLRSQRPRPTSTNDEN